VILSHRHRAQKSTACLRLSDGSSWAITGRDERADPVVARLAETMQLQPSPRTTRRLLVTVREGPCGGAALIRDEGSVECVLDPANSPNVLAAQLQHLSQVIALHTQDSGAVLIHGALAAKAGKGIILAGRGDAGKTTASSRLKSPWQSLSDDTTLVVRHGAGAYRAHPWPTWSTFMFGGKGGTWDSQRSVALKGIFLLEHAREERAAPLGRAEAICLLSECAEQVTLPVLHALAPDEARAFRVQRFDNLCDLTGSVPSYRLRLSLTGRFWEEVERVL
jgi:SynChlorMet cassette protein ScmC